MDGDATGWCWPAAGGPLPVALGVLAVAQLLRGLLGIAVAAASPLRDLRALPTTGTEATHPEADAA